MVCQCRRLVTRSLRSVCESLDGRKGCMLRNQFKGLASRTYCNPPVFHNWRAMQQGLRPLIYSDLRHFLPYDEDGVKEYIGLDNGKTSKWVLLRNRKEIQKKKNLECKECMNQNGYTSDSDTLNHLYLARSDVIACGSDEEKRDRRGREQVNELLATV